MVIFRFLIVYTYKTFNLMTYIFFILNHNPSAKYLYTIVGKLNKYFPSRLYSCVCDRHVNTKYNSFNII